MRSKASGSAATLAVVLLAFVSALRPVLAQDANYIVRGPYFHNPKDGPKWTLPYMTNPGNETLAVFPPHAPKSWSEIEPSNCQPLPAIRIPKTHVGFLNILASKITIIVAIPDTQQPEVVTLEFGEFVTVGCGSCAKVTAVIPRGVKVAAEDLPLQVAAGEVYVPKYDKQSKLWQLSKVGPVSGR